MSNDAGSIFGAHSDDLVPRLRSASPRSLGRLISTMEASENIAPVMDLLPRPAGNVIGLTGPPGAGKSTTVAALAAAWQTEGRSVAVLAIDPSSPLSGGAVLGDRVRMGVRMGGTAYAGRLFYRSMSARGHMGGTSNAVPAVIRILAAAGYERVVVETVGVGQSELEIRDLVDTLALVTTPDSGDEVQAVKSGIMEVVDLVAVNKSDLSGADTARRKLRRGLALTRSEDTWMPPVVAMESRSGRIDDLVGAIEAHGSWLGSGSGLEERRAQQEQNMVARLALAQCRSRLDVVLAKRAVDSAGQVAWTGTGFADAVADLLKEAFSQLDRPGRANR